MKVKQGRISLGVEKEYLPSFAVPLSKQLGDNPKIFSSAFGFGGKNDPRSLNDKTFLDFCIKDILNFLNGKGFTEFLPFETLSVPSGKNFNRVLLFLIKKIDPFFTFKKKPEEDIPLILKNFFYPFVPAKGTFHSLENPRIWSALIGCLKWIIELLHYDAQVFTTCFVSPYESVFSSKSIWKQMAVAYYVFLSGTEEYRKFFQILWAIIKNKTIYQKKKQKNLTSRIQNYQKKNFFILDLLSLIKNSKNKEQNLKRFTKGIFSSNVIFSSNILALKEFYNKQTEFFQFVSGKKREKKSEFSRLLKSLSISKIETDDFAWKIEKLLTIFKLLNAEYRSSLLAFKLKFFQITQKYLKNLKKKSNSFFKFDFFLLEFSNKQTSLGFRKIFSPELEFLNLFNYNRIYFNSFLLTKGSLFRNFNQTLENIENFLFVFRKNQYFSKKNLIPRNYFQLSRVNRKLRLTEKNFQIFFQAKENQAIGKILLKQSILRHFFLKRNFFSKIFLNRFKIMTLKERLLLLHIFFEIKSRFLNQRIIFSITKDF